MIPFSIPEMTLGNAVSFLSFWKSGTIEELESDIRARVGTRHAVALPSARYALTLLYGFAQCDGKKVLASPYTCVPAIDPIRWAGAVPVFSDIDPESYNLAYCPELESRDDISAVCLSYLYGLVSDPCPLIDWARRKGCFVIEDAAIALGASWAGQPVGSLGDAGVFSLQSSKIINGWRGGVVTTDRDDVAEYLRAQQGKLTQPSTLRTTINVALMLLRRSFAPPLLYAGSFYWMRRLATRPNVGKILQCLFNQDPGEATHGRSPEHLPAHERVRFSKAQARLVQPSLKHLDGILAARRHVADSYRQGLGGTSALTLPSQSSDAGHAFGRFPIRIAGLEKTILCRQMARAGVEVGDYYPYVIPDTLHFANEECHWEQIGSLPHARKAAAETVLLPMHTALSEASLAHTVRALHSTLSTLDTASDVSISAASPAADRLARHS